MSMSQSERMWAYRHGPFGPDAQARAIDEVEKELRSVPIVCSGLLADFVVLTYDVTSMGDDDESSLNRKKRGLGSIARLKFRCEAPNVIADGKLA